MGLFSFGKKGWACKACSQDISVEGIGAVMKDGKITIPASGNCDNIVKKNDEVLCDKCSLQVAGRVIIDKAIEENRPLSITELRSLEEQLRSKNLEEVYFRLKDKENIPENSTRYTALTYDSEGQVFVEFTCPNCSETFKALLQGATINAPDKQLQFFANMHEIVPMTCSRCNHYYNLYK